MEEKIARIQENPSYFIDVYEKTPELCLAAVQKMGYVLRQIPKKLQNEAICKAAVEQDGRTLKYVSKKILNEELCTIDYSGQLAHALKRVQRMGSAV